MQEPQSGSFASKQSNVAQHRCVAGHEVRACPAYHSLGWHGTKLSFCSSMFSTEGFVQDSLNLYPRNLRSNLTAMVGIQSSLQQFRKCRSQFRISHWYCMWNCHDIKLELCVWLKSHFCRHAIYPIFSGEGRCWFFSVICRDVDASWPRWGGAKPPGTCAPWFRGTIEVKPFGCHCNFRKGAGCSSQCCRDSRHARERTRRLGATSFHFNLK